MLMSKENTQHHVFKVGYTWTHQKASVRASGDSVAASDTSHCKNDPSCSIELDRTAVTPALPSCAICCSKVASRWMPSTCRQAAVMTSGASATRLWHLPAKGRGGQSEPSALCRACSASRSGDAPPHGHITLTVRSANLVCILLIGQVRQAEQRLQDPARQASTGSGAGLRG